MRAAVIRGVGQAFDVTEVEIAQPIDHEVLVDVRASGVCHSDIYVQQTGGMNFDMPILLGHEIAGVVAAVGPLVTRLKVGDHVVGAALQPCGGCRGCLQGKLWACRNPGALGRTDEQPARIHDELGSIGQLQGLGGFAEQALIHENQLVAIDKAMPFEQASIIGCAVVTGGGAIFNVAKVRPGETVAVFGCGGVGLNALQSASLAGATRIIGIDVQDSKLDLAKHFGASDVINSSDTDVVQAVRELTGGEGVDHAFVMVGVTAVADAAVNVLGFDGTVYLVGATAGGAELPLRISPADTVLLPHQQGVRGSWLGSSNFYHDIPMYVDLYRQGRYNLDDLVSKTIPLDEINEACEAVERGEVARAVITFPATDRA
ncbi:Zn-dependent alcohol dehydrogenase [Microbacterium trichothecenolyticum]|uniref:Aryl-alcohol dehydrogenase n=1 Tax=Microbacterium trichothecenolyticum TaxID=69370 RepID=A0A0M2HDS6_MICTR|nr:Zn-dependent alcohol dehydrogenase [Microbacterium trichothecenolyticum]KJL42337.1 Aryl-alcohol dehydrogenase [Microbacterium trichothecenolyticum]